jgi:hypothetical protein
MSVLKLERVNESRFSDRADFLKHVVEDSWNQLPRGRSPCHIVHLGREGVGVSARFYIALLSWSIGPEWLFEYEAVPTFGSGVVLVKGSGKGVLENVLFRWEKHASFGTSRAIYGAFVDAISGQRRRRPQRS